MYDKNQDMLQQCINTYNLIGKVSHPSRTTSPPVEEMGISTNMQFT